MPSPLDCTIIGGGMITHMQILPSIYQLQREGVVGEISISALNGAPLKYLAESDFLNSAYPGQSFTPYPDFNEVGPDEKFPELFKELLGSMKPRQVVAVALPDQLHYGAVKEALEHDQHIMCVKPLVLNYEQAVELEELAYEKGLVVGVEYHKRFDDRSLIARKRYRDGLFGEFKSGQSSLVEPWYYRHSNFQNWCTCENSDAFTYIGCHYVDLVAFITGLMPTEVSVYGQALPWPNGKLGYLWTDARVIWENGACLNVLNGFGYPDDGPGGNYQGMVLYSQDADKDKGGIIEHDDCFRGVGHGMVVKGDDPGDSYFANTSPDYFQMIPYGGPGFAPVGYGFRSIAYIIKAAHRAEAEVEGMDDAASLARRREIITEYDEAGIMSTPKNASYNELVIEAGRLSITSDGAPAVIEYGKKPKARLK